MAGKFSQRVIHILDVDPSHLGPRKLIWDFGITGKKLGFWDYTLFEIGILEIMLEIGIWGFQSIPNWDFGISSDINSFKCEKEQCQGNIRIISCKSVYAEFEI